MILLVSIILIYLSLINLYLYTKQTKEILGFRNIKQYIFSIISLFFFFFVFLIFFRILNFFKESKIIDLKIIISNFDLKFLLLILIFIFTLRKLLFLIFKLSFFKLHYYYLAPSRNKYYEYYYILYIKYFYKFCSSSYKYLFWIDKILMILLILLFFKDCIFNNLVLSDVLNFLKYYSLFKIFYIILRFVATKQNIMLDYYLYNLYYIDGVSIDEGFFAETLEKHYGYAVEYEETIIRN